MPGAGGQLKKLYQQLIGGTAPSGAASASGDIGQMIKYQIDNPSSPTFNKRPAWATSGGLNGFNSPIFHAYMATAAGGWIGVTNFNVGSLAASWDATLKQTVLANVTGANCGTYFLLGSEITPYGRGGKIGTFDLSAGSIGLLRSPAYTTFVLEWHGKFTVALSIDTTRGVGISSTTPSSTPFASTRAGIGVWLLTGNKWAIQSSDASAASSSSESSGTGDTSYHVFRLEFTASTITLYVDNVSKVTHSTNLPLVSTTIPNKVIVSSPTGDASNSLYISGWVAYWK